MTLEKELKQVKFELSKLPKNAPVSVGFRIEWLRPPLCQFGKDPWYDIRSLRIVDLAFVTDDAEFRLDFGQENDLGKRVRELVEDIFALPMSFIFYDLKHFYFGLWNVGIFPVMTTPKDIKVMAQCLTLGKHAIDPTGVDRKSNAQRTVEGLSKESSEATDLELENIANEYGTRSDTRPYTHHTRPPITIFQTSGAMDQALVVFQVYESLIHTVRTRGGLEQYLDEVEFPFIESNAKCEWDGVLISRKRLDKLRAAYTREIGEAKKVLRSHGVSEHMTVEQMSKKVRDEGIELESDTPKGLRKVQKQFGYMEAFLSHYKWKDLTWLCGRDLLFGLDGRIHPNQKQIGTATGRSVCSRPGLTSLNKELKALVIAPKGKVLLDFDYKQFEFVLMVTLFKDEKGLELVADSQAKGVSVYSVLGKMFYGEKMSDKDAVKRVKNLFFAIVYGQSDRGLSEKLGVTPQEARREVNAVLEQFPKVKQGIAFLENIGVSNGYAEIVPGLQRHLPIRGGHRNWVRRWMRNTPIQGLGAVVLKRAHRLIYDQFKNTETKVVLSVYDGLLLECPKDEAEDVRAKVSELMRKAGQEILGEESALDVEAKIIESKDDLSSWGNKDEFYRCIGQSEIRHPGC